MKQIKIGKKIVGEDEPVFIIAELSANHNQNYNLAVKSIKAMKDTGVDAIKLQTYTPDTITIDSTGDTFQINQGTIWDGKTLHKLYQEAYTPWEWQPKLKKIIEDMGMICFSSPFDKSAVDFLEKMDVPAYKVASFEITDIPLIEYMASKNKPIIIATGVAKRSDIEEAVAACKRAGNEQIAILKCTSAYPAPYDEINLKTIPDIKNRFDVVPGLSDHTLGTNVSIAACALGAKIIEKHFIIDRKLGGPDAPFSLEPKEFADMVRAIRDVEKALGKVNYELTAKAKKSREHCRSLYVVADIEAGEEFNEENVRSIRPGFGMPPKYLKEIMRKKARVSIKRGTPLSRELIRN